ncbi:MAG: hypothetical protein EBZ59_03725 [Planctomycetia bacterium]|nr:hypothetical protein [Planctomycetia bacterium]
MAAPHVIEWLERPAARHAVVARLEAVARDVARGGSAGRAADAVLAIAGRRAALPRTDATAAGARAA